MGKIIFENSLKCFFYKELMSLNQSLTNPAGHELIYYSSLVLDHLSTSDKFFQMDEGRLRNKILGEKLLSSEKMSDSAKARELKDIGDTTLIVCGVFADSFNQKIIDSSYYIDLGRIAYERLNAINPIAFDQENFYQVLSDEILKIIEIIKQASRAFLGEGNEPFLLKLGRAS